MNTLKKIALAIAFFATASFSNAQNKSLEFDGVNDYLRIDSTAGNNLRTIELRFKPSTQIDTTLTRLKALVARNTGLTDNKDPFEFGLTFIHFGSNKGKLRFFMSNDNNEYYFINSNSNSWDANNWYHVAAVVDSTNGMAMYIDGIKQLDTNAYGHHTDTSSFYTAAGRWGDFTENRYFDGKIDNLKFSSTALYNSNFTPECPDTNTTITNKGTWNFNDSNAVTAFDLSINNYDASIIGAVKKKDTICYIDTNYVLKLDGIDDYLNLGTTAGNNVRTIELWFKSDTTIDSTLNRFKALVVRNTGLLGANDPYELGLTFVHFGSNEGRLDFFLNDNIGNIYSIYSDSNSWTAQTWYHVAAVVDSLNGMSMYIDGIKQQDTNAYNHHTDTSSYYTAAGRWGDFTGNRYFDGRIDNLKFSSIALYSSNFIPECPDSISTITDKGTWDFNTSSTTTAFDLSINNYDASIIGANKLSEVVCSNGSPRLKSNFEETSRIKSTDLLLYPNPTRNKVQFELKMNTNNLSTTIQLIDINGKIILTEQTINSKTTIDLSKFSNGIYFYRLIQRNEVINTGKLIKQ